MKIPIWYVFFLILTACYGDRCTCEPKTEPKLRIYFQSNNLIYDKVYPLGYENRPLTLTDRQYVLPISLSKDTITYIFEKNTQKDTLTLISKRKFYYQSPECGFVYELTKLNVDTMQTSFQISNTDLSKSFTYPEENQLEFYVYANIK